MCEGMGGPYGAVLWVKGGPRRGGSGYGGVLLGVLPGGWSPSLGGVTRLSSWGGVLLNGGGHCCGEPRAVPFCPSVPPCSTCTSICLSVHLLPRLSIHLSARPYGRLFLLRRPPPPLLRLRPPAARGQHRSVRHELARSQLPARPHPPPPAPHCLPPRLRTPSPPSPSALFTSPSLTHTAPQHLHVTAPPAPLPPPGEKGLTAPGW